MTLGGDRMNHRRTLTAAVLAAVSLAACGGSSATSSHSATASSPRFTGEVNAVCARVNAQIAALPTISTTAELLITGAKEITMSSTALAELQALTAPAATRAAYERYLSGIVQEKAISLAALAAIKAGQNAEASVLGVRGSALNTTDDQRARALGLTQCARDVQPAGSGG
ncbi:MAG: hypothetical protein ABSH51_19040 [Solirubrobacteraceae bacterium]